MPVFYSHDYLLAVHTFDTTRKAGWVAQSLQRQPLGVAAGRSGNGRCFARAQTAMRPCIGASLLCQA